MEKCLNQSKIMGKKLEENKFYRYLGPSISDPVKLEEDKFEQHKFKPRKFEENNVKSEFYPNLGPPITITDNWNTPVYNVW